MNIFKSRYRIVEKLGEGGTASVFLARDMEEGGRKIALKAVKGARPKSLEFEQFKREFRSLSNLHHPNICQVYDFGYCEEEESCYFTCEYVQGKDFLEAARSLAPLDLLPLIVQTLQGLEFIHHKGIIHFDVKPANLLVSEEEETRGRVKLLDFGLSMEFRTDLNTQSRGTPLYMAPEVIQKNPADNRADLYSLGIVIYQALTGSLPFSAEDPYKVLQWHLQEPCPPPGKVCENLPPFLDQLVLALVEKDPQKRFGSAREVLLFLSRESEKAIQIETPETLEGYIGSAEMVGREEEMFRLKKAWFSMSDTSSSLPSGADLPAKGKPIKPAPEKVLFLIKGKAGSGKSRLLSELKTAVQLDEGHFFTGRCFPEDRACYSPLRQVLRSLLHTFGAENALFKKYAVELRKMLPELARGLSTSPPLDPQGEKTRLFEGITQLLIKASQQIPFVLCFEDIQWADASTLEFLLFLSRNVSLALRRPAPCSTRFLLTLSFREEEISKEFLDALRTREDPEELELKDLSPQEIERLIASMTGVTQCSRTFVDRVVACTSGSPFFIRELLKILVDQKKIHWKRKGFDVDLPFLDTLHVSERVTSLALERLKGVLPLEKELLKTVSLFNKPVPRSLLLSLHKGEDGERVSAGLGRLQREGFLLKTFQSGDIFYHVANHLLRRAIYELIDAGERVEKHRTVAQTLRGACGDRVQDEIEEIAYHLVHAQDRSEGLSLAFQAGQRSFELGAYEKAEDFYQSVLQLGGDGRGNEIIESLERLGDLADLRGSWEKAVGYYRRAAECIPSDCPSEKRLWIHVKIAQIHLRQGDLDASLSLLEATEKLAWKMGSFYPAIPLTARGAVLAHQGKYQEVLESCNKGLEIFQRLPLLKDLTGEDESRVPSSLEGEEECKGVRVLARTFQTMADTYLQQGDYEKARQVYLKILSLLESLGDPGGSAVAHKNLGNVYLRTGEYNLAEKHYKKSITLQEQMGDLHGLALNYNNLGIICKHKNNYLGATEYYQKSLDLLERIGDELGQARTLNNLANIFHDRSRFDKATEYYWESLKKYEKLKDSQGISALKNNLAGIYSRVKSEYTTAIRLYQESLRIRRNLGSRARIVATLNNMATIFLEIGQHGIAEKYLKRALNASREEGLQFEEADSLRLLGMVHLARENFDVAERHLLEALQKVKNLERKLDEGRILIDLGSLYLRWGKIEKSRVSLGLFNTLGSSEDLKQLVSERALLRIRIELKRKSPNFEQILPFFEEILEGLSRQGGNWLLFQAQGLFGQAFQKAGERVKAYSQYVKTVRIIEETLDKIHGRFYKKGFLQTREVQEIFLAVRALKTELMHQGKAKANGPLPEDIEALFNSVYSDLYRIEKCLNLSQECADKNNEGLKRILEISQGLNALVDIDDLFRLIVGRIVELTRAERGFLILTDKANRYTIKVAQDSRRNTIPKPESEVSSTILSQVIKDKAPLLTHDAFSEEGLDTQLSVLRLDLRSIMCVPMIYEKKLLGILYVDNRSSTGLFKESDLELLTIFANQAAIALERTKLFKDLEASYHNLKKTQSQLVRTEKLSALGQMAAGVAHDFNNLLTAILGRAQLLQMECESPKMLEELRVIEKVALDGAEIIKRIQNFSRKENVQDFEPVDLAEVIEDVIAFTRNKWKVESLGRDVSIQVKKETEEVPFIEGNPSELRRALTNLIFNAIDALPKGGEIVVRAKKSGEAVVLEVSDTGIGMSEETRMKIFDPFFSTKGHRGVGLGLSEVYGIVTRHRGSIDVFSEEGKGTTFRVEIPASKVRPVSPPKPEEAVLPQEEKVSILVIDDEQGVCSLLKKTLQKAGYQVKIALSGEEGITSFREEKFDVVLTDLSMPGMTGWEVAQEIKKVNPNVPIALVTGWALKVEEGRMKEKGIDMVINKPFTICKILKVIPEVLSFSKKKPVQNGSL